MVLSTYQAAVECRGTFGPRKTCETILDDMKITQATEIFGPKSDPAAQVTLPAILEASKISCCKSCAILALTYIHGS